ncbi:MAG: ACP S-malonyltransferase [Lentisphaeria bacterium]|nr:ACP S-malonyltransferase [Lentisphaeria bacterium]
MKAAFIFSGQGAQSVGMGRDIFEKSPAGRSIYEKADEVLGWKVSGICFDGPAEKLTESRYCQVAIFVTSMACLASFHEQTGNKVVPVGTAGLSLGEYSALCCSGFFQFEDALRLVAKRAELMDEATRTTKGTMAAIITTGAGAEGEIARICAENGIGVANYNSPFQVVISGSVEGVASASAALKGVAGVRKVMPLTVAGAYHSPLMAEAGQALIPFMDAAPANAIVYPIAQNYTGSITENASDVKGNLIKQVAGSVRWVECVNALSALGADTFIEFGPGSVLTGLVKKIDSTKTVYNVSNFDDPAKIVF